MKKIVKKIIKSIIHFFSFIKKPIDIIRKYKEKNYCNSLRCKLKNDNFTIICNNCVGGIIYHNLGKKFLSPTINLSIRGEDYLNFCKNIEYYSRCDMIDVSTTEFNYPVGEIVSENSKYPNIKIYFMHSNTFKEAKEEFFKRYKRINYDNIFYIWEFYDNLYDVSLIEEFDKLPIKKISILHKDLLNVKNKFVTPCYKNKKGEARILKYKFLSGKRYLDEWDYVEFLNN